MDEYSLLRLLSELVGSEDVKSSRCFLGSQSSFVAPDREEKKSTRREGSESGKEALGELVGSTAFALLSGTR